MIKMTFSIIFIILLIPIIMNMGILNMMIVIPMGIETVTFGPIMKHLLGGSAINAILFGGVFFIIAAILSLRLKPKAK